MIVGLVRGKKAGIFGGFPFEQTTKEEPDRHRYWRIFMICSSVSIVVSGLVFLIAGARSAENVFEDVNDGVDVSAARVFVNLSIWNDVLFSRLTSDTWLWKWYAPYNHIVSNSNSYL
jgi:hypothetical protein